MNIGRNSKLGWIIAGAIVATATFAPGFAGDAEAQQPKLRVPAAFQAHLEEKHKLPDGREVTYRETFDQANPATTTRLPGGRIVTLQQYLDMLAGFHAAAQRHGLHRLPRETFPSAELQHAAELKRTHALTERSRPMASSVLVDGMRHPLKMLRLPVPEFKPFGAGLVYEWGIGIPEYATAGISFSVGLNAPAKDQAGCTMTWEASASLLKKPYSFAKFTASYGAVNGTLSAHAAFFLMGQSTPKWQKSGSVSDPLQYSYAPPPENIKFDLGAQIGLPGIIGVQGSAGATFTVALNPTASSGALPPPHGGVQCSIGVNPTIKATAGGSARLWIGTGYGDLLGHQDLIDAGIVANDWAGTPGGQMTLIDFKLPVADTVKLQQTPRAAHGQFKVDVDSTMMAGKIYAYYKIHDACIGLGATGDICWGFWMSNFADAVGIPMSSKYYFWKSQGDVWKESLADWSF